MDDISLLLWVSFCNSWADCITISADADAIVCNAAIGSSHSKHSDIVIPFFGIIFKLGEDTTVAVAEWFVVVLLLVPVLILMLMLLLVLGSDVKVVEPSIVPAVSIIAFILLSLLF